MKFLITLSQDEDGMVIAECPAIPGCVSQGSTEAEAEKNVGDAIRECLAARRERNPPLMITTKEVEIGV